jgi:tRNA(fMet)-specific endonuclease VapC
MGGSLVISFMTLAELERWVMRPAGAKRAASACANTWNHSYTPPNRALCTKWAEVTLGAQASGYRIDCADAWIAATALLYDLPLVTHNRNDYRGVRGLTLISHGA